MSASPIQSSNAVELLQLEEARCRALEAVDVDEIMSMMDAAFVMCIHRVAATPSRVTAPSWAPG